MSFLAGIQLVANFLSNSAPDKLGSFMIAALMAFSAFSVCYIVTGVFFKRYYGENF